MAHVANTKSILNVLKTIEYKGEEIVDLFKKFQVRQSLKSNVNYFDEYIITSSDSWDSISFDFYGTERLWWLLAKYNNVIDPYTELVVSDKLKIIKPDLISTFLLELRDI